MLQRCRYVQQYTAGTETGIVSMYVMLQQVDPPAQHVIRRIYIHCFQNSLAQSHFKWIYMEFVCRSLMLAS
jgi:hypothetical protein